MAIALTDHRPWQECPSRWRDSFRRVCHSAPEALVSPANQAELCEVMQLAQQERKQLLPCGNGSKLAWGGITKNIDWLVSTQRLNHIVEHAVDDLTITLQTGVPLQTLREYLAPYKQIFPVDPAFPDQATIGGIIATADTGSWRQRYGGVRDLLLGITVVRTDGKVAKAGGKVVKNVAGYDLMKLFTGSYGSLAIATEVTLRLFPQQEAAQTILLTGNPDQIQQAQQHLRNSVLTPTRADILNPSLAKTLNLPESFGLLVGFEAIHESVTAQQEKLQAIATELHLKTQPWDEDIWQQIPEILYQQPVHCKIGLLPTKAIEFLEQLAQRTEGQAQGRIHSKSGLGTISFPHEKFLRQFRELRQFCENNQGFLTILDAPYSLKTQLDPWGYSGDALPLMKAIKQKFDPQQMLSPGRFLGL